MAVGIQEQPVSALSILLVTILEGFGGTVIKRPHVRVYNVHVQYLTRACLQISITVSSMVSPWQSNIVTILEDDKRMTSQPM